jgi:hypothetical protein
MKEQAENNEEYIDPLECKHYHGKITKTTFELGGPCDHPQNKYHECFVNFCPLCDSKGRKL